MTFNNRKHVTKPSRLPMKFRPLHDRVVVERIDAEAKSAGGIIIPDTAKEKPSQGEVIAVGPGGRDEAGKLMRTAGLETTNSYRLTANGTLIGSGIPLKSLPGASSRCVEQLPGSTSFFRRRPERRPKDMAID